MVWIILLFLECYARVDNLCYITKPFEPAIVRTRVQNHLELKRYREHLEELVKERTRELALTQEVTIESMATLAEYRDTVIQIRAPA